MSGGKVGTGNLPASTLGGNAERISRSRYCFIFNSLHVNELRGGSRTPGLFKAEHGVRY